MSRFNGKPIFETDHKAVINVTGGGIECISHLTHNGGASAFLLEANVPYSYSSLQAMYKDFGFIPPAKAVSYEAAKKLAVMAFTKAVELDEEAYKKQRCFGIGATSKLTYEGEREGRIHEAYLAFSGLINGKLVHEVIKCSLIKSRRWVQEEGLSLDIMEHILYMTTGKEPCLRYSWKEITE